MEISVKDYVRDKNGRVGKVFDITNEPSVDVGIGIIPEVNAVRIDKDKINYLYQEEITKHSKDIIDLVEVGDYVNGSKVIDIRIDEKLEIGVESDNLIYQYIQNNDIKSILTHEQFESNAYKIEKER